MTNRLRKFSLIAGVLGPLAMGVLPETMAMEISNRAEDMVSIHIPPKSGEKMAKAAGELSGVLERMFGKPFPMGGDGQRIILGTIADYPEFADKLKVTRAPAIRKHM